MCHLVNMHRSGQWNITIGSTKKKIIDKLIIAKDIIVEGSSKILILQKDSFFLSQRRL